MLKTEPVVQFVSNCKTWSKRETYVAELSKYINVTQYGACGDNSCPGRECLLEKIGTKKSIFPGPVTFFPR